MTGTPVVAGFADAAAADVTAGAWFSALPSTVSFKIFVSLPPKFVAVMGMLKRPVALGAPVSSVPANDNPGGRFTALKDIGRLPSAVIVYANVPSFWTDADSALV